MNSRLAKIDGRLEEQVYRAGTPDGKVPPGLYAEYLAKANSFLRKAAAIAEPAQARAIRDLIRFYQTGDPKDWLHFGVDWVQNNAPVDFDNGFIEVYRDARGAKGTSQSFVTVTDNRVNSLMLKIAANAQYFEDRAPWAPAIQEARREAAARQSGGNSDRDRRFPRYHRRRQPAQRRTKSTKSTASKSFLFTGQLARPRARRGP